MRKTIMVPRLAIAGMVAAAVLAGCAKSTPDENPAAANDSAGDVAPAASERERPVSAAPAIVEQPTVAVAPPATIEPREPPAAPDAQMLDDADATGMTAHVSREEAAVNQAAPE